MQLSYANIPAIQAHVKSGRLRPLATTGPKRAVLMPDVPTMKESGVDMDVVVWYGVLAPAATPRDIVSKLAALHRKGRALAGHPPEAARAGRRAGGQYAGGVLAPAAPGSHDLGRGGQGLGREGQ